MGPIAGGSQPVSRILTSFRLPSVGAMEGRPSEKVMVPGCRGGGLLRRLSGL